MSFISQRSLEQRVVNPRPDTHSSRASRGVENVLGAGHHRQHMLTEMA